MVRKGRGNVKKGDTSDGTARESGVQGILGGYSRAQDVTSGHLGAGLTFQEGATLIDSTTVLIDSLASVLAQLEALQKSVINWDVLRSFLGTFNLATVVVIVTAWFAIYSFNSNRKSRRAVILPGEANGYFRSVDPKTNPHISGAGLRLTLNNFGLNPASDIDGWVVLIDQNGSFVYISTGSINPVAPGEPRTIDWHAGHLQKIPQMDKQVWGAKYVALTFNYYDMVLKTTFDKNWFYWAVTDRGELTEALKDHMAFIKSIDFSGLIIAKSR